MPAFCSQCGKPFGDRAAFCSGCGAPVPPQTQPAPAPLAPAPPGCQGCGRPTKQGDASCEGCVQAEQVRPNAAPVPMEGQPVVQDQTPAPAVPPQPLARPTAATRRAQPAPPRPTKTYQDPVLTGSHYHCPRCNAVLPGGTKLCSGCQTEFVFPVPMPASHGAGSANVQSGRKEALTPKDEAYVNQFRAEMAEGLKDLNFCKKCGEVVSQGDTFCTKCCTAVAAVGNAAWPPTPTRGRGPVSTSSAPPGYETTFERFDAAGGRFLWTWNWAAFAGGPFWFFAKGLPKRGALWLLGAVVGGLLSGGALLLVMPFLRAVIANWVFYRRRRTGVEEWSPKV